jgi:hypothetical protein
MASARHRRRSGKKKLGYKARGGAYSDQLGGPPKNPQPRRISNEQATTLGRLCDNAACRTAATA